MSKATTAKRPAKKKTAAKRKDDEPERLPPPKPRAVAKSHAELAERCAEWLQSLRNDISGKFRVIFVKMEGSYPSLHDFPLPGYVFLMGAVEDLEALGEYGLASEIGQALPPIREAKTRIETCDLALRELLKVQSLCGHNVPSEKGTASSLEKRGAERHKTPACPKCKSKAKTAGSPKTVRKYKCTDSNCGHTWQVKRVSDN